MPARRVRLKLEESEILTRQQLRVNLSSNFVLLEFLLEPFSLFVDVSWCHIENLIRNLLGRLLRFNLETDFTARHFGFFGCAATEIGFRYLRNVFKVDRSFWSLACSVSACVGWRTTESRTKIEELRLAEIVRFRLELFEFLSLSSWIDLCRIIWMGVDEAVLNFNWSRSGIKILTMATRSCVRLSIERRQKISDQIIGRCCWPQLNPMILQRFEIDEVSKISFNCRKVVAIKFGEPRALETEIEKFVQVQSNFRLKKCHNSASKPRAATRITFESRLVGVVSKETAIERNGSELICKPSSVSLATSFKNFVACFVSHFLPFFESEAFNSFLDRRNAFHASIAWDFFSLFEFSSNEFQGTKDREIKIRYKWTGEVQSRISRVARCDGGSGLFPSTWHRGLSRVRVWKFSDPRRPANHSQIHLSSHKQFETH